MAGSAYPPALSLDWEVSGYLFRPPKVVNGEFVHPAASPVIKWLARVRAGALATNARTAGSGLGVSTSCLCCHDPVEDDAHAIAACPATGAQDCASVASRVWAQAAQRRGFAARALPDSWIENQLTAALIPSSMHDFLPPARRNGDLLILLPHAD